MEISSVLLQMSASWLDGKMSMPAVETAVWGTSYRITCGTKGARGSESFVVFFRFPFLSYKTKRPGRMSCDSNS